MNELAKFLLLSNDDLETAQLLCDSGRYRIADLLREAYHARQACDYESDMSEDETMAKNAIANAQTFISEVKILLS